MPESTKKRKVTLTFSNGDIIALDAELTMSERKGGFFISSGGGDFQGYEGTLEEYTETQAIAIWLKKLIEDVVIEHQGQVYLTSQIVKAGVPGSGEKSETW